MGHHHDQHGHHHHHQHGSQDTSSSGPTSPSDRDKLLRMLEHWLRHNEEHAVSYQNWAAQAKSLGEEGVQALLEEMAAEARRQNQKLEAAIQSLGK